MVDRRTCTGCSACMAVCSVDAIRMEADDSGFLHPVIDPVRCVNCGKCMRVCPVRDDAQIRTADQSEAFLAYSDSPELRQKSSSGGVFSLLAQMVLRRSGIVFGCAMAEDCYSARHTGVDTEDHMWRLRGSKYVQSDLNNSFREAKHALERDTWVLFSGTPCQIAGLTSYLGGKRYEKLLTVDVICHGVPSPMVWASYLKQLEQEAGAKACEVSFRNKSEGWQRYSLNCKFSDGTEYRKTVVDDLYLRGFVEDLYLRSSCYHCRFKDNLYQSDITLGDFWGVSKLEPELEGCNGASVAVAHSCKGKQAILELRECCIKPVSIQDAMRHNRSYYRSVSENMLRDRVIDQIKKNGIKKVLWRYCGNSLVAKVRKKLYRNRKKQIW